MVVNLTVCVCFFISLLVFVYDFFTKKRISSIENRCFKSLAIANLVGLILEILIFYLALNDCNEIFLLLINKIIFMYYTIFMYLLVNYFYIITNNIKNDESTKYIKFSSLLTKVYCVFLVVTILLPFKFSSTANYLYPVGISTNFQYLTGGVGILGILYMTIRGRKKIKKRDKVALYATVIFAISTVIIQYLYNDLMFLVPTHTVVLFLIYFCIENPDLKIIAELNFANTQVVKANNAKSQFLSSMSHEIRTPLNAIVGLSESVVERNKNKEINEDLEDIINASYTLLEIVGNILDINKIESNKLTVNKLNYNIYKIVDGVVKIAKTRIGNKDLKIVVDIEDDVPSSLLGDVNHIKTVMMNLITNAVKYSDQGVITVTVKCINENIAKKTLLMISVEDQGRGIKKENITKLFDKFERLDVEKNSTMEGTGLGLAITKQLVELMNGKINVQSNFGKGSLFIVQLPQDIGQLNESESKKDIDIALKNEKDYSKLKILIVDDNELNVKVAQRMLADLNCKINAVYDGLQCLEKVKKGNEYDLILMDIMMPNMSGISCLKKLKEKENFSIPVIALTADAVSDAEETYTKEGFSGYVSKPFNKKQIIEMIHKIV